LNKQDRRFELLRFMDLVAQMAADTTLFGVHSPGSFSNSSEAAVIDGGMLQGAK
jgi:hypothetical protein